MASRLTFHRVLERLPQALWWFRFGSWRRGRRPVNVAHAAAVERRLSIARALLALVSLGALLVAHPLAFGITGLGVLVAYSVHSVGLAVLAYARSANRRPPTLALHLSDVVWVVAVTATTGASDSPFFAFHVFTLLAAGYRWGLVETVATGVVGTLAVLAQVLVTALVAPERTFDLDLTAARLAYVLVGAVLIGYLAEDERRHRVRAWAVSRIMSRVRAQGGLVASVQAVLDELMKELCAARAVLTLEEEGNERVSVWQAEPSGGRTSMRLRQEQHAGFPAYLFEVPARMDAWVVLRGHGSGANALRVMALDADGVRIPAPGGVTPLLDTPFPWREAICLSSIPGDGWNGRLFLFDPQAPGFAEEHLRFLQVVVRQVGPALFNLYLQRRLQSRSGVVERARISRALHDGVIQSLIGVEMQIEVLRRKAPSKVPEGIAAQLTSIQGTLRQEILNVRDLMQLLKPMEVDAERLVEHLAEVVDRFRQRTNIKAQLACDADDIDLSPRVCRELAGTVQEALANVRKHSEATSVLVRLGACGNAWQLAIDDNGRGFDFEGTLDHDALDEQRRGPVLIKERVRAIGGRLTIHSQPRFGSRLEITIPRKHHG